MLVLKTSQLKHRKIMKKVFEKGGVTSPGSGSIPLDTSFMCNFVTMYDTGQSGSLQAPCT
jgi:hypothetical protein